MNTNTIVKRIVRFLKKSGRTLLLIVAIVAIFTDAWVHYMGARKASSDADTSSSADPAPKNSVLKLTPAQMAAVGIVVEPLTTKPLAEIFRAPGEVKVNDYSTSNVGTRVSATVIARHAKLGERVRKGQVLVTLYSADMGEAQSSFVLATKYNDRIRNLGSPYVSGKDLDEAQVKQQETRGRLETYGLMPSEIADLARNGLATRAAGQFDLTAAQDGVITVDNFRVGEVADPAKPLFEIANLANVWVEAQVSPQLMSRVKGDRARIYVEGKPHDARIIQRREQLDQATRTLGVRLQLDNPGGTLKPGQFVDVELFGEAITGIVVPTASVLRDAEGRWIIYVENDEDAFEPRPVQVLRVAGEETAISGIPAGTRIVTKGAFFVKSEADKANFADHD